MTASSSDAFITAIEEILVSGSSAATRYPLPDAAYGLNFYYEDKDIFGASASTVTKPEAFIKLENQQPHNFVGACPSNLYDITVEIYFAHNLEDSRWSGASKSERLRKIANDVRKVQNVLEASPNLEETIGGTKTGLAGGQLFGGQFEPIDWDVESNVAITRLTFEGLLNVSL